MLLLTREEAKRQENKRERNLCSRRHHDFFLPGAKYFFFVALHLLFGMCAFLLVKRPCMNPVTNSLSDAPKAAFNSQQP